jgi:hypothetical protein
MSRTPAPFRLRASIPPRPNADDVGHALIVRAMPPHLHDRADPDIRPRALHPTEPRPVSDLVCPGSAPAGSSEVTGRIVSRGHGPAASG